MTEIDAVVYAGGAKIFAIFDIIPRYTLRKKSIEYYRNTVDKNSSGDEIANVNLLTTRSHTRRPTSKYRKRDKPTSFNKLDDR